MVNKEEILNAIDENNLGLPPGFRELLELDFENNSEKLMAWFSKLRNSESNEDRREIYQNLINLLND